MSKDFDRLPLVVNGKTVIFPCVEVMALSTTPKAVGAEGYVAFFEAFVKRYGAALRFYRLSDSTKWKKVLPKDLRKVSRWFSDARTLAEPLLGITMHPAENADEPRPPLFEMMFDHVYEEYPRGMFRMVLPLDVAGEDASGLLELIDEAMAEFPVHWGSAGYAFYWKGTDTQIENYAEQWLGRHLVKHPGLSTGDYLTLGTRVENGLANIGWLTFVGDELIGKLGGREAITLEAERSGVGLREYSKGVALQAGPTPELGNVNRKKTLPLYKDVGRILQPVFAADERLEKMGVIGIDDDEEAVAWLKRFLP